MIEIQKGIFLCNKRLEEASLDTIAAMHPYFKEGKQKQVSQKYPGEDYCQARERIFREWKNRGNVVVFEMSRNYWFENFNRNVLPKFEKGLYLIPTHMPMPDPAETNWTEVAKFLKSFGRKVLFIGGGYGGGGCLNGAIRNLREQGITGELIEEACYL